MTINTRPLLLASEGRNLADFSEEAVWDTLSSHGAIVFRGFGVSADGFYDYAARFTEAFLVSPFSDRVAASETNELQTVTLGSGALGLHFEYGSSPLRPDLLWFYCRKAPTEKTGGETLLADGVAIFDQLSTDAQAMLRARRLKYRNHVPVEAFRAITEENDALATLFGGEVVTTLCTRCDFTIVDSDAHRVVFEYVAPATMPIDADGTLTICGDLFGEAYANPDDEDADETFSVKVAWEDGTPIAHDILGELKAATRSLTRGIRWRDGDFALIDNNRQLHGRNRTSDPCRDLVMLSSFSHRFKLQERHI